MGRRRPSQNACPVCGKALAACICRHIQPIDNPWEVWILQHPTEQHHPLGTARILSLSLKHSKLLVGEDFSANQELNELINDDQRSCFLVYPDPQARTPEQLPLRQRLPGKAVFLLLDGTWRKTHKMMALSRNLQDLPKLALSPNVPSRYRLRRASRPDSLSTVEAGYLLLAELSGTQRPFAGLIRCLDAMIEYQISRMPPKVLMEHYGRNREPQSSCKDGLVSSE